MTEWLFPQVDFILIVKGRNHRNELIIFLKKLHFNFILTSHSLFQYLVSLSVGKSITNNHFWSCPKYATSNKKRCHPGSNFVQQRVKLNANRQNKVMLFCCLAPHKMLTERVNKNTQRAFSFHNLPSARLI